MPRYFLAKNSSKNALRELGQQLVRGLCADLKPTMVCILKGAVLFYTDLRAQRWTIPLTMDFMAVSSYGNSTKSSGEVEIRKDLSTSIEGKHVVIVEDIVDSGFTLSYLYADARKRAVRQSIQARARCWTSRPAVHRASPCRRIIPAFKSATNLWSDLVWTTRSFTGTCRISAC